jgi:uncharacterized protein (TIGR02594 family)
MYATESLKQYAWLAKEHAPRMLIEALKLYGVTEVVGMENNPAILAWADEIGVGNLYNADSVPWCGLFVGVVAKRAGKPVPHNSLWARNWAQWGMVSKAELGCVLVFSRETGGHVGLYVGEDDAHYHVLGGNQSDCVCIRRIEKSRMIAARSCYNVKPDNVRIVKLAASGAASTKEV